MADLYYIDSGYLTPDAGYFVYTADVAAAPTATSTMSATVGVIKQNSAAVTSTFTVSATITDIKHIFCDSFGSFALSGTAQVIRAADLAANSAFTIATDFVRTRSVSGDEFAAFDFTADVLRSRDFVSAQSAAFSLACDATLIPASNEGAADLFVSTSLTAINDKIVQTSSTQNAVVSVTAAIDGILEGAGTFESMTSVTVTISHIEGADLTALSNASMSIDAERIRDYDSAMAAEATLTGSYKVKKEFASSYLASFFGENIINDRIRDFDSAQSSSSSLSSALDGILSANVTLAANATVAATISHIEGADLSAFTNASLSATATRIQSGAGALSSAGSISVDPIKFTGVIAALSSSASLASTPYYTVGIMVNEPTTATLTVGADKLYAGPTMYSGGTFDTAYISSTSKFGSGSLGWTLESNVYPTHPTSSSDNRTIVLWTGTKFVTASTTYKWESTDGVTWTRSTNVGGIIPENYANGYYYTKGQYSSDLVTWNTISYTIPGTSGAYLTPIGYAGGYYYIFTTYFSGGSYRLGYARATSLNGTWTGAEMRNTSAAATSLNEFYQGPDYITIITGNLYIQHISGTTITNLVITAPTASSPTQTYEYNTSIGLKSTTEYLYASTDSVYFYNDVISYKNGASTGTFRFYEDIYNIAYINNIWFVSTALGVYKSTTTVPTSKSNFTQVLGAWTSQVDSKILYGASKYLAFGAGSYYSDGFRTYYSSDATTWTEKYPENMSGLVGYLEYTKDDGYDLGHFSTIDFWVYNDGTNLGNLIKIVDPSNNAIVTVITVSSSSFTVQQQEQSNTTTGTNLYYAASSAITWNGGWNHVRLSVSGSTIAMYANGVRKLYDTAYPGQFNGKIRLSSTTNKSTSVSAGLVDEFYVSDTLYTDPSVTSFSVPTTRWTADANTDLLLHFDGDYAPAGEYAPVDPKAWLFATTAVSATIKKTMYGTTALSSTASVSASVERFRYIDFAADLTAAFSVSAQVGDIKPFTSTPSTSVTLAAEVVAIRDTDSAQQSSTSITIDADVTRELESNLISTATITTTISHIHGADLAAFGDIILNIETNVNKPFDASLAVTTSQESIAEKVAVVESSLLNTTEITIDAVKTFSPTVDLSSEFSLTAIDVKTAEYALVGFSNSALTVINDRIRSFESTQSASSSMSIAAMTASEVAMSAFGNASLTVSINKFVGVSSTQTSNATATIDNARIRGFDSNQSSSFTSSTNAVATKVTTISADTSSALTATISHIEGAALTGFSNATLAIDAFVGKVAEASLSSSFTTSVSGNRIRYVGSNTTSAFSVTASVEKIQQLSSSNSSQFTQTANVNRRAKGAGTFSTTSTLTARGGDIKQINITAFNTGTLTVSASKFTGFAITATSSANVTATALRKKAFAANWTLSTSLFANATKAHAGQATLQATSTIQAIAGQLGNLSANMNAAMVFVAIVREIDIDSINQFVYIIPREVWTYTIGAENRTRNIQEETRIFNVRSY